MAGRSIWDPAITAGPCRKPCEVWWHVHDDELPSNRRDLGEGPSVGDQREAPK